MLAPDIDAAVDAIRKTKQVAIAVANDPEARALKLSEAGESQPQTTFKTVIAEENESTKAELEDHYPAPGLLQRMIDGCQTVFRKLKCSSTQYIMS